MTNAVAILGLGKMGCAIAEMVSTTGLDVRTWSRSSTPVVAGATRAATVAAALDGAQTVLLCLYDAQACHDVLAACADQLVPQALVVNTSTVAPDEAMLLAAQARGLGARYLHAPVLGSVPKVRSAALVVLAGGEATDVVSALPVLELIAGEVRHVGSAGEAAAYKLVANSALAGALLGLRDALSVSHGLGLDLAGTLDILTLGHLGGIVAAKRTRLDGTALTATTDFAAGALRKDVLLAARAAGVAPHTLTEVDRLVEVAVSPGDDIAALALARVPMQGDDS